MVITSLSFLNSFSLASFASQTIVTADKIVAKTPTVTNKVVMVNIASIVVTPFVPIKVTVAIAQ